MDIASEVQAPEMVECARHEVEMKQLAGMREWLDKLEKKVG
jgi:hypothetical protein